MLPVSEAPQVLGSCSPLPGGDELGVRGAWLPDPPLVAQVEARLPVLLDSVLPMMTRANGIEHVVRGDDYYRQYLGLEVESRRMVYVHGFHESLLRVFARSGLDVVPWRSEHMSVCDAGGGMFGVFYDPGSGTFGRLEFSDSYNGAVRY